MTMEGEINDIDSIVLYWRTSSDLNYSTMQNLMKTKEYPWGFVYGASCHRKIDKGFVR